MLKLSGKAGGISIEVEAINAASSTPTNIYVDFNGLSWGSLISMLVLMECCLSRVYERGND